MVNTSFMFADLNMENVATPYHAPTSALSYYRYRDYPSGDLKTTIEDLSHFIAAYINRGQFEGVRILEEDTVEMMLTVQNPASGICLIWDHTVGDWYGHAGGKVGMAAYVEFQRDQGVGLIVISNYRHESVYPGEAVHALVRRVARRHF